jgi:hypothetical protein
MAIPNVWPIGNIINLIRLDPTAEKVGTSKGAWYFELGVRYLRLSTYLLIAMFIQAYMWPDVMKECTEFGPWVGLVFGRNLAIGWLLYGGWHWILYESPFHDKMESRKYNPKDQYAPGTSNLTREMWYTTQGLAIGALYECLVMWLWATHRVPMVDSFFANPVTNVAWVLFVPYCATHPGASRGFRSKTFCRVWLLRRAFAKR